MAALVVWYASGVGCLMSVLLPPQSSLTAAVAAVMVLGGFLNGVQPRLRSLAPTTKHALGGQPASPHCPELCDPKPWHSISSNDKAGINFIFSLSCV